MDSQYQQSSQGQDQNQDPDQFRPSFKKLSKNQKIYGDFYQAYQPQNIQTTFSKRQSYNQFKAGSTIQTYSSQVQVDLPKNKPKKKNNKQDDDDDQPPMLGKFNLKSFLNQYAQDDLQEIQQNQQQQSKQQLKGLTQNIRKHLQLVKIGEEVQEEVNDIENMNFQRYMKLYKSSKPRNEPKYKTQQEKELAKEFSAGYGIGFKMLEKMGFNITKGLGKNETGTSKPIQAVFKTAFTMKDEQVKNQQESQGQQQQKQQIKQLSIPQQLFQYRSKNIKINDFLLEIKHKFEKTRSQIYFLETQIMSSNKRQEINQSTKYQIANEINDLKIQIQKLQDIKSNLLKAQNNPHLGQHYKLDLLFLKKTYQKLKDKDIQFIYNNAQKQILNLKSILYKFYQAKSKQSMKQYQKTTGIQLKMKNLPKSKKKQQNIINLDNQVQQISIGLQQQQKIKKYTTLILRETILILIQDVLQRTQSLDKIKNIKIIDLIDIIIKFQFNKQISPALLKQKILPLYEKYLQKINLDLFQQRSMHVQKIYHLIMPHVVIMPWLHILKKIPSFNLNSFLFKISSKIWNIQYNQLFNIIYPFLNFMSQKQLNYFINLTLAPRMYSQFQQFKIKSSNMSLLAGFKKYCQIIPYNLKIQIIKETILIQIHQTYQQLSLTHDKNVTKKWLQKWKKFCNQICQGASDQLFNQFAQ